jgi:hypothetical protein
MENGLNHTIKTYNMKKTLAILTIVCALIVVGCEKNEKYDSTGMIIAADMTECACCGGYFIKIDDVQYRFEKNELPSGFTFIDEQLPLSVELNWKLKTGTCVGFQWISISKIKAIK